MKTFAVSSMDSAGPFDTSSTTQEGLENFTLVEKTWKFNIQSGYYLTKAEMNNFALYPSDQYISPLMISDDNLNWVPVEQAIGKPFGNSVLYAKTAQLDPLLVQSIADNFTTNKYALSAYSATASGQQSKETVSLSSVGYQYFTLEFASAPVMYPEPVTEKENFLLTDATGFQAIHVGSTVDQDRSTFLLALPWWEEVSYHLGIEEVQSGVTFKAWLIRFQKESLLDTLHQEVVAYYDSADLGTIVHLTGTVNGNKGTQGMMLVVQAVYETATAGLALLDVYLSAQRVTDLANAIPTPNKEAYTLPSTTTT